MVFFIEKVLCQNMPRGVFRAARTCQEVLFTVPDRARNLVMRLVMDGLKVSWGNRRMMKSQKVWDVQWNG
jgi:hypothetical protein